MDGRVVLAALAFLYGINEALGPTLLEWSLRGGREPRKHPLELVLALVWIY